MTVIDSGRVKLFEPSEHLFAEHHEPLPALVALSPVAAAHVPWIRIDRVVEIIEASDPHDDGRMVAVMAHPHRGTVEGTLLVLFPDIPPLGIHHVLVRVENILCYEVSLAIGGVEITSRVGGISAGIDIRRAHLGERVPHLHPRTIIETRLPQMDYAAVEEELAPLHPELSEAELLVVFIIQARPLHC